VETGNGRRKCLKLCFAARDVGWRLDAVHQALPVVLDALSPELTLGHAAVCVSHVDFTISRHQVLEIARLLLLLGLFLSFALRQLVFGFDLGLRLTCLSLFTLRADAVRLLGDSLVVLVLVEALVRDVIVGGGVLHRAIDRSVTIAFLLSTLIKLTHLVFLFLFDALVLGRLVLLDVLHEAA